MERILLLFLVFTISSLYAQNEKQTLEKEIKEFIRATNELDAESLVKYLPLSAFKNQSEDGYILKFKKLRERDSTNVIQMDTAFIIDSLIIRDTIQYARFSNQKNFTFDFTSLKDEKGVDITMSLMKTFFEKEYGEENVIFDQESLTFYIKSNKPVYGIKRISDHWRFAESNPDVKKLLPPEIIKEE